jgi:hypothetical protein
MTNDKMTDDKGGPGVREAAGSGVGATPGNPNMTNDKMTDDKRGQGLVKPLDLEPELCWLNY